MIVRIPVANENISGVTGTVVNYNGLLPVWATRPMEVQVQMSVTENSGIGIQVLQLTESGGYINVNTMEYPYTKDWITIDLSYASVLIPVYERNKSFDGNKYIIQVTETDTTQIIRIPIINADLTYWQTLGVEAALPQPPKIKMPSQPVDLLLLGLPGTVYPCTATPVTGYSFWDAMPTTVTSGKTIDIKHIKKLVISDYPSSGLDYEVDYEDRPWTDANNDESLQCALRLRWNMHNGQWYWAAFKSFFWSNKFTFSRGRGGVTEQAEITVNLEYTKEEYTVYQQLLTSSNIFAMLNIEGIMQYPQKEFRLDVSGNTGARWNGNDRVYRQQVKFLTTTLQDNYMPPGMPDLPPEVPAQLTQSTVSTTVDSTAQEFSYTVNSNIITVLESKPDWCTIVSPENGEIPIGSTPVRFRVSENAGAQRTGTITIRRKGGGVSLSHGVIQQKSNVQEFGVTPESIDNIPSSGGSAVFQVTASANTGWTLDSYPNWLTTNITSGAANTIINVTFTVAANMESTERMGDIDFLDENGPMITVSVSQKGKAAPSDKYLFMDEVADVFVRTGEELIYALRTNYTADELTCYSDNDMWCTASIVTASDGIKLEVSLGANTNSYGRFALISIRTNDTGEELAYFIAGQPGTNTATVLQPYGSFIGRFQRNIIQQYTALTRTAFQGYYVFMTNSAWAVESMPSFIAAPGNLSGGRNGTWTIGLLDVEVQANQGDAGRAGLLTISKTSGEELATINVAQSAVGDYIDSQGHIYENVVNNKYWTFSWNWDTSKPDDLFTDVTHLSGGEGWCRVIYVAGMSANEAECEIEVDANTTGQNRSAVVTVWVPDTTPVNLLVAQSK